MIETISEEKLKELYPDLHPSIAYAKFILEKNNLSRETKIACLFREKSNLLTWFTQVNAKIVEQTSFIETSDPDYLEPLNKQMKRISHMIEWMDMRILELSSGPKLKFKEEDKDLKPEEEPASIFKTRDEFILFFNTLKDCGILPPETEQKQIAFFLHQVMGYSQVKLEQAFSAYRNKSNKRKKRQNARAVIMALEKAVELLKTGL